MSAETLAGASKSRMKDLKWIRQHLFSSQLPRLFSQAHRAFPFDGRIQSFAGWTILRRGHKKCLLILRRTKVYIFLPPLFSSCSSFPGVQLAAPLLFFLLILLFLALLSPDPDPPPPRQCEANKKEQDSTHPWHHTLEEEI